MKTSCSSSDLKKEVDQLRFLEVSPPILGLQKVSMDIIATSASWLEDMEHLLRDVGIQLASSDKGDCALLLRCCGAPVLPLVWVGLCFNSFFRGPAMGLSLH